MDLASSCGSGHQSRGHLVVVISRVMHGPLVAVVIRTTTLQLVEAAGVRLLGGPMLSFMRTSPTHFWPTMSSVCLLLIRALGGLWLSASAKQKSRLPLKQQPK